MRVKKLTIGKYLQPGFQFNRKLMKIVMRWCRNVTCYVILIKFNASGVRNSDKLKNPTAPLESYGKFSSLTPFHDRVQVEAVETLRPRTRVQQKKFNILVHFFIYCIYTTVLSNHQGFWIPYESNSILADTERIQDPLIIFRHPYPVVLPDISDTLDGKQRYPTYQTQGLGC